MSGERNSGIDLPEGEPPITDDELREAEALRSALEHGEDPFATALRSAFEPKDLTARDLDAILARALQDGDAPPTELEEHGANRLKQALDEHDAERQGRLVKGPWGKGSKSTAAEQGGAFVQPTEIAIALRAAWAPSPIPAAKNDALVSRALGIQGASKATGQPTPAARRAENDAPLSLSRFRLRSRTLATMTAVVAMAAGVLLFVARFGQQADAPAPASVAQATSTSTPAARSSRIAARSTTDLFDATTPFPRTGGESARVDRIASARASDLRANRFLAWGVR